MYADSLLAEILKTELESLKSDLSEVILKDIDYPKFMQNLSTALNDMFDGFSIQENNESNEILINMDSKNIIINKKTLDVKCDQDKQLEHIVINIVNQIKNFA